MLSYNDEPIWCTLRSLGTCALMTSSPGRFVGFFRKISRHFSIATLLRVSCLALVVPDVDGTGSSVAREVEGTASFVPRDVEGTGSSIAREVDGTGLFVTGADASLFSVNLSVGSL